MNEFLHLIRQSGLRPPDYIEPRIFYRFPGLDKSPSNRAGWCKLFDDQSGGVFGDWSTGLSESWQSNEVMSFTPVQRKLHNQKVEEARMLAEAERVKDQALASTEALKIWESSTEVGSHPYLDAKSVNAYGIRKRDGDLVIPIYDGDSICSIQTITQEGRKRFLSNGKVQGCYFVLGQPREMIYICEGYATAATLHQSTDDAVVVAFNAGNLKIVAESIRLRFGNIKIVIAGDNDSSGVGQEKARKTAQAVSGRLMLPPEGGDWNDFATLHGIEKLSQLINSYNDKNEGNEILIQVQELLRRFVSYPDEHCLIAHVLWIAHTHLIESFESTPRLAFLSPEPASGKTRALEITELLVPNPVLAVNVTPAYLFRKVGDEESKPTILYDEIDTIFGPKAKGNEEIRGLLNAGHRKGAVAGRCVTAGNNIKTEEISAYGAVALAGLGNLPDTILSRSVIIKMRRRSPNEKIEPYRRRDHRREGEKIRDRLSPWCAANARSIGDSRPDMPIGIEDRDADIWEPLVAIADAAAGDWPQQARDSAVAMVNNSKVNTPSLGLQLLEDLHKLFGDRTSMHTTEILSKLNASDESPWGNLGGSPLDARGLAKLLRQYEIRPSTVRMGDSVNKGYKATDFFDVWSRYLPHSIQENSVTSVTSVTNQQSMA